MKHFSGNAMSHISLQTQTSLERLIPSLNNQTQTARQNNQNQSQIASTSIHTPSVAPARHGMTYSTRRSDQYTMYLPSGTRTASGVTNQSYGPSPSSYRSLSSPSQVASSNLNTNNTQRYTPLVQPYVPDRNNSIPQLHPRANPNYTLNQTSTSANASSNTNINASVNSLLYRCPSNTISSPPAGAASSVTPLRPLSYPHATSSTFQGVSPHSAPLLAVNSNARPCLRQTVDNQGSDFSIRSRATAFHSNIHPDVPSSNTNHSLFTTSTLPPERYNTIDNPESCNDSRKSTPSSVVCTRRRTIRTRAPSFSTFSGLDPTTGVRNTPSGKKKAPIKSKKQGKKKKKSEEKEKVVEKEKEQCSICLEIPSKTEEAAINGCSHKFCFQCIEKWADRENTCPLCKVRFTKIDRVHKTPAKKRKKGDSSRQVNTKRVKKRDQRADIMIGSQLQGLLGEFDDSIIQQIVLIQSHCFFFFKMQLVSTAMCPSQLHN